MIKRSTLLWLAGIAAVLLALLIGLYQHDQSAANSRILSSEEAINRIEVMVVDTGNTQAADAQTEEAAINSAIKTPLHHYELVKKSDQWLLSNLLADALQTNAAGTSVTQKQIPADSNRIAPLLALLNLPDRTRYTLSEVDLEQLGLESPRATVQLNDLRFQFGDASLDGNLRYVLVNDEVHLYQEYAFPLIRVGPQALITQ